MYPLCSTCVTTSSSEKERIKTKSQWNWINPNPFYETYLLHYSDDYGTLIVDTWWASGHLLCIDGRRSGVLCTSAYAMQRNDNRSCYVVDAPTQMHNLRMKRISICVNDSKWRYFRRFGPWMTSRYLKKKGWKIVWFCFVSWILLKMIFD